MKFRRELGGAAARTSGAIIIILLSYDAVLT